MRRLYTGLLPTPLLLSIILLICISCGKSGSSAAVQDFEPIYTPEYATGFEILGDKNRRSSLIRVIAPWQGDNPPVRELFIQRDGEPVPAGFSGQVLTGDAERIVCMSSTQIAMLHLVDASKNVVGVSGLDFIAAQEIQSRRAEIGDVGYDGNIDYELLVSLKPDLVMLYGVFGEDPMEKKLRELGIPFLYVGEYLEESPVGKAEWTVAVAETVGRRQHAEVVFAQIPENYDKLRKRVEGVARHPKVMLNMPYRDSWFLPPAESYFTTLIADAGGDYVFKSNTSRTSKAVDLEEAFMLAGEADVWLNLGSGIDSADDLVKTLPKFESVPSVRSLSLYNNNLRSTAGGGNDFYESGVVNPDLVLRDLIKAFHPELVPEPFTYYTRLPRHPEPEREDDAMHGAGLDDVDSDSAGIL